MAKFHLKRHKKILNSHYFKAALSGQGFKINCTKARRTADKTNRQTSIKSIWMLQNKKPTDRHNKNKKPTDKRKKNKKRKQKGQEDEKIFNLT